MHFSHFWSLIGQFLELQIFSFARIPSKFCAMRKKLALGKNRIQKLSN